MSLSHTVGVLFFPLFSLVSVCNGVTSQTATLTSSSLSSSIADISLVSNNKNYIDNVDGAFCTKSGSGLSDTFTVKLNVFNNKCDGIETVSIKVYGGEIDGDVDIMALFSVENSEGEIEFLSYMNDWDNGMKIYDDGDTGGVFTAPKCGSNKLFINNIKDNFLSFLYNVNGWSQRLNLGGGSYNNWQLLNNEGIGFQSPLTFTIINDINSNKILTKFNGPEYSETLCELDTSFDTFDSGNDYVILFGADQGTVKFKKFDVSVSCDGENLYTIEPTQVLEYSEMCEAYGDPHIISWDNQAFHFQGEGYFDYVKSCNDDIYGNYYLPFKVSARHDYCGKPYSCVGQIIINIDDGNEIIIPSHGDDVTPIFSIDSSSAIGTHTFTDNNGNKVIYSVDKTLFEISYIYNGENAKMEVYYTYDRLRIQTTESMIGFFDEDNLCGLCGTLDGNSTNELKRCDNLHIIDNKYVDSLNNFLTPIMNGTAYENINKFGESCCNRDLDLKYLSETDCGEATPAPLTNEEFCWQKADKFCEDAYLRYCDDCQNIISDEWIDGCVIDFCSIKICQDNVLQFNLQDSIENGCLDTSVRECIAEKYNDFFPHAINFC